jgi:hypothetical protein
VDSPLQSGGCDGAPLAGAQNAPLRAEEVQARDALPVLAEGPVVSYVRPLSGGLSSASTAALVPAAQAAAAAAGGFLAGAAVIRLLNRRHRQAARLVRRPRAARPARLFRGARGRSTRNAELVQIVGSRSLLVDVHLLAER